MRGVGGTAEFFVRGRDGAALFVTHDQKDRCAEMADTELDAGEDSLVHDVARVADDEDVPLSAAEDEGRRNSRVGASEHRGDGRLSLGDFLAPLKACPLVVAAAGLAGVCSVHLVAPLEPLPRLLRIRSQFLFRPKAPIDISYVIPLVLFAGAPATFIPPLPVPTAPQMLGFGHTTGRSDSEELTNLRRNTCVERVHGQRVLFRGLGVTGNIRWAHLDNPGLPGKTFAP